MLITNIDELNEVRKKCKSLVQKRAAICSVADFVPIPGTGIVADIGMLRTLIPEINKRFGLSDQQIENLDVQDKLLFYGIAKEIGSALIGKIITKPVILSVLKQMSARVALQNGVKWLPGFGPIAASILNFLLMLSVGNSHIDDCYKIVAKLLQHKST